MSAHAKHFVILALIVGACQTPPPAPPPVDRTLPAHPPQKKAVAAASPPAATAAAPPSPGKRVSLGTPKQVVLPADLRPVRGNKSALVVASDLLADVSYLRRIDDKGLGPLQVHSGRHPVGELGRWIVTADGDRRLCIEDQCHAIAGDYMVMLAGTAAFIEERELPKKKDDKKKKSKRRKKKKKNPSRRRSACMCTS